LDGLSDRRPTISLRGRIAPEREARDPETRETSLWGDRDRMLDRVHRLAEQGVEHLVVDPDTSDPARFLADLEWTADVLLPEVLPLEPARRP
jgi:isopentenyl diphosphate isomerase/L-lactate dehydrogenase-like FMN-dependent dehydrogenase